MPEEVAWIRLDGTTIPRRGASHADSIRILLNLKGKKRFSFDVDYYVRLNRLVRVFPPFNSSATHIGFDVEYIPSDKQIKTMAKISDQYCKPIEITFVGTKPVYFKVSKGKYLVEFFKTDKAINAALLEDD